MDLILWRHAEAEEGLQDELRALTKKGEKQAVEMAGWLKRQLPDNARILVSPARRARQTADALKREYALAPQVGTGASFSDLLAAAGWPDGGGTVVVVGHQPTLGQVAAHLLAGGDESWSIKKGAVWWFGCRNRENEHETVLKAAMSPEFL